MLAIKKVFCVKLFVTISLGFILFAAVGTLSHEFGHYIVAKHFGYNASIDYRSTNYNSTLYKETKELFYKNREAILSEEDSTIKSLFQSKQKQLKKRKTVANFWWSVSNNINRLYRIVDFVF